MSSSSGSNFLNNSCTGIKPTSEPIAIPIPTKGGPERIREEFKNTQQQQRLAGEGQIPIWDQRKISCSENASQATEYESMADRNQNRHPTKLILIEFEFIRPPPQASPINLIIFTSNHHQLLTLTLTLYRDENPEKESMVRKGRNKGQSDLGLIKLENMQQN
ncbi:hypothetical protein U1Q18_019830 [Sarracenia purpurea var. burkii]